MDADQIQIPFQYRFAPVAEGSGFAQGIEIFPVYKGDHIGGECLQVGEGQTLVVGTAVLAAVTAPHEAVSGNEGLFLFRELPLPLGDLRETAGVVDPVHGDGTGGTFFDAQSALDAELGEGPVEVKEIVRHQLSDDEEGAVFGMDDQTVHPGEAQSGGQGALPFRQGGHVGEAHKGGVEFTAQLLGGLIQELPHNDVVVGDHGVLADIGSGVFPGVVGEGADDDALGILWDPFTVPAGQELRDPVVVADTEGADLVPVQDLTQLLILHIHHNLTHLALFYHKTRARAILTPQVLQCGRAGPAQRKRSPAAQRVTGDLTL